MLVEFINTETNKSVLAIDVKENIVPNTGDLVVTPNNVLYRVMQRAFITTASSIIKVAGTPAKVDVSVQCAVSEIDSTPSTSEVVS